MNPHFPVLAGKITIAYKAGDIRSAIIYINQYNDLLTKCENDNLFFESRICLSQSLVYRKEKQSYESYEMSKEGNRLSLLCEVGLGHLWICMEHSMNAAICAFQHQNDKNCFQKLRNESLLFLDKAAAVASQLLEKGVHFRRSDTYHKLCIYKALVLLNFSITGEFSSIAPSEMDVSKAADLIECIYKAEKNGEMLTPLRRSEHCLVQSDYFRRLSELNENEENSSQMREIALKHAQNAKKEAKLVNIKNMEEYADYRLKDLRNDMAYTETTPEFQLF